MNLPIPPDGTRSPVDLPGGSIPGPINLSGPAYYRPKFFLPVLLFFLTLVSTTISGALYHYSYVVQEAGFPPVDDMGNWNLMENLQAGFPYAYAVVGILLAHELGHYLACRYYGIAATLPFFIPFPLFSYAGTMGAFIRIKSPFRNRKELFDVGVAGPLAGYVFALPALIVGIKSSQIVPFDPTSTGYVSFGEPLIFKLVAHAFFNYSEATETLNLHPIGWAAWFGIFATSINLFPAGQLDGGHMIYALLGPRLHRKISVAVCAGLVAISAITWTPAYLVFGILVFMLGLGHPQPVAQEQGLDSRRTWIAALAALIFILSFIPIPIRMV